MIPGRSGTLPTAFEAAVTAIHLVRSESTCSTAAAGSSSVSRSGSAKRTAAPARSAAISHGATLASWSRRVQTTSSPGSSVRPTAAAKRIVSALMLSPKTIPCGSPPRKAATLARVCSTSSSVARAAAKAPPWLALRPERIQSAIASIAASTICVPAGPSSRAQPSARPGKRSRFTRRPAARSRTPSQSLATQSSDRLAHQVGVARIRQRAGRPPRLDPLQRVDLVVGLEARAVAGRLHQPVAHDLEALLVVAVAGRRQLGAQDAAQAGLLLDLANRRRLPRLAAVELALRQRPVVVARPVHDEELEPALAVAVDDAAGRPDLRAVGIDRHGVASWQASGSARGPHRSCGPPRQ